MTVTERIRKYLAVVAKIRMDSRPRLVNKNTGAFYIIPTFDHLRTVLDLIDKAGSNIRPYQTEWYEKIFIPAIDEMENKPKEYWKTVNWMIRKFMLELVLGIWPKKHRKVPRRLEMIFFTHFLIVD